MSAIIDGSAPYKLWPVKCPWCSLGGDQQHSSGPALGLSLTSQQELRCGKLSGNVMARTGRRVPFAGLSSQQWTLDQPEICPAAGEDWWGLGPVSGDRVTVLQLQMTSLQSHGAGITEITESVYTSLTCFRIYSSHVLLAGPPRECVFLLHCVPFHSFVVEPGFHLCHLCLSLIQLHQKRRIQGRWKEPQRLSDDDQNTAKIAHTLVNQQQHKLGDLFWYFLHL